jgi:hypothetical protein
MAAPRARRAFAEQDVSDVRELVLAPGDREPEEDDYENAVVSVASGASYLLLMSRPLRRRTLGLSSEIQTGIPAYPQKTRPTLARISHFSCYFWCFYPKLIHHVKGFHSEIGTTSSVKRVLAVQFSYLRTR